MLHFLSRLLHLRPTTYAWLVVVGIFIGAGLRASPWQQHSVFYSDMGGYYLYLPSTFSTRDLGNTSWLMSAANQYRPNSEQVYYLMPLSNGKVVFKYTMGMAVAYAPFFFLARGIYLAQGNPHTVGFEPLYEQLVFWGCMAYVVLGLWLLGRELSRYFRHEVAALTLLVLALGSNLLYYATVETLMSHGTIFLLHVLLLRATRRWYGPDGRWRDAVGLGLVGGLLVLIRPSELMLLSIPVLWNLLSWAAVAERLRFWRQRWLQVVLAVGLAGVVAGQQLLFWRLIGGQWEVPFYKGENFNFADPHLLDGIFSFRKGWLVYSPLMALSLVGIAWVRRWAPAAFTPLVLLVPVYFYVTFCWWNWEYGGSYGGRSLIDIYPLLAFGLAAFWQRWLPGARWVLAPLVIPLVLLSVVQNYQYLIGLINCCAMSWELYRDRFLMLGWPQP